MYGYLISPKAKKNHLLQQKFARNSYFSFALVQEFLYPLIQDQPKERILKKIKFKYI
jgi:hypothetical protein